MERTGELRYRVECIRCGRRFIVKDILSPVPKHPPKGQPVKPYMAYIPCVGSEVIGRPIGAVV